MKRYLIIFNGRVQGVGFRYFTMQSARGLKMTGHVRNMTNGDVEVEIQGESHDFNQFLQKVLKGNGWIRIDDYSLKELPILPHEENFIITGY